METSSGPPISENELYFPKLLKSDSDPNIKKLPKKILYRFLSRFISLILTKVFKFPNLLSLMISEFICAFKRSKTFKKI